MIWIAEFFRRDLSSLNENQFYFGKCFFPSLETFPANGN